MGGARIRIRLALLRRCQSIHATIRAAFNTATGTYVRLSGAR